MFPIQSYSKSPSTCALFPVDCGTSLISSGSSGVLFSTHKVALALLSLSGLFLGASSQSPSRDSVASTRSPTVSKVSIDKEYENKLMEKAVCREHIRVVSNAKQGVDINCELASGFKQVQTELDKFKNMQQITRGLLCEGVKLPDGNVTHLVALKNLKKIIEEEEEIGKKISRFHSYLIAAGLNTVVGILSIASIIYRRASVIEARKVLEIYERVVDNLREDNTDTAESHL